MLPLKQKQKNECCFKSSVKLNVHILSFSVFLTLDAKMLAPMVKKQGLTLFFVKLGDLRMFIQRPHLCLFKNTVRERFFID